jgi:hypothetical protein
MDDDGSALHVGAKYKSFTDLESSSLAKGYDSGPPSFHPWQI